MIERLVRTWRPRWSSLQHVAGAIGGLSRGVELDGGNGVGEAGREWGFTAWGLELEGGVEGPWLDVDVVVGEVSFLYRALFARGWVLHFPNLVRQLGNKLCLFFELFVKGGHVCAVLSGS